MQYPPEIISRVMNSPELLQFRASRVGAPPLVAPHGMMPMMPMASSYMVVCLGTVLNSGDLNSMEMPSGVIPIPSISNSTPLPLLATLVRSHCRPPPRPLFPAPPLARSPRSPSPRPPRHNPWPPLLRPPPLPLRRLPLHRRLGLRQLRPRHRPWLQLLSKDVR